MRPESSIQPADGPVPTPVTVDVLGVRLALTDYDEMLGWIDAMVASRQQGYLCACNVHTVMASREDPVLRASLDSASINVPDGQPLVWAINSLGHSLRSRVYGPELMSRASGRAADLGHRFYLYGGRNQGALVQLALNLRQRHPGVKIVGGYSPPHRQLTGEEQEAIVDEINHSEPDVVWAGIGVPKQEKWMADVRAQLEAPVLIGVGAAFDFHAGLVPQAPNWVQESGLEWAYRLAHEPRRLWKRYLRYNPKFLGAFARQLAARRRDVA
jgi:N-acetylglucosaminyldiphosphoundecaprenol N-acetyl-beta-D-mannosaminyltransferase